MHSVGHPLSGSEITAQVRRAHFNYSLQALRSGAFSECMSCCVELMKRSSAACDSLNFYASKRIATLIPACCSRRDISTLGIDPGQSTEASKRQQNMLMALEQYHAGNLSEAVTLMQCVCGSLGSWKNADEYTSSAYSWLATFARLSLLATRRGHETTYENLKRTFSEAVRNARRVAERFEEEKPHALREAAWYSALFGTSVNVGTVLHDLHLSLLRARATGQTSEELATLQAWDSMYADYELCIPQMSKAERVRLTELSPSLPIQENRAKESHFCETLEETVAMMVSAFENDVNQESNCRVKNECISAASNR